MGAVDTTYTFTATDTITSSKMNNIIDQTTITGDAITGTTLEVVSGKLKVRSQNITSNELATDSVTSTKIIDGAVTSGKLSTGGPTWDGGTTYMAQAIELGATITTNTPSFVDFHSSYPLVGFDARIIRESGVDGDLKISNTGTGSIKFNDVPLGAVSGDAPIFGARAWAKITPTVGTIQTTGYKNGSYSAAVGTVVTVNIANHELKANDKIRLVFTRTSGTGTVPSSSTVFNVVSKIDDNNFTVAFTSAAVSSGTVVAQFVVIPSSKNISSGTFYDSGARNFVLNFSTPMPNANYASVGMSQVYAGAWYSQLYEFTDGATQRNTQYNIYLECNEPTRFANVVIFA